MGARPGRVIADVPIDEPYPRSDAFRVSTTFARHCQRLSALVAEAGAATPAVTVR
jgi:NitT/TauT family transport system ATP-binding protein